MWMRAVWKRRGLRLLNSTSVIVIWPFVWLAAKVSIWWTSRKNGPVLLALLVLFEVPRVLCSVSCCLFTWLRKVHPVPTGSRLHPHARNLHVWLYSKTHVYSAYEWKTEHSPNFMLLAFNYVCMVLRSGPKSKWNDMPVHIKKKKKEKRMDLSRFGSGLMCTIRSSATACQQPNGNSGRAAGVPLIIYLRFDGGNWSSVATTKQWLIKGCLFRNQNLLLDRLLHLEPIISSSSPSHMLNSARMWELHHIRMHVFLWCTVQLWVCVWACVQHALLHHVVFEKRASFCIYRSIVDFVHLCAFPSFDPCPFIYIQLSAHDLAWVENFPIGLRRWPEREAGFRRIIMVYIAAPTAASHYRRRRSWPSEGNILFRFSLSVAEGLEPLALWVWAPHSPLTFSAFCCRQTSRLGGQRKGLCSLLGSLMCVRGAD